MSEFLCDIRQIPCYCLRLLELIQWDEENANSYIFREKIDGRVVTESELNHTTATYVVAPMNTFTWEPNWIKSNPLLLTTDNA